MKTLLAIHQIDEELDPFKEVIQLAAVEGVHLNILVLGLVRA